MMAKHPDRAGRPYEQIVIEAVSPCVDGGRHPAKGIVGDTVPVEATVFRHGHERVRAALLWKEPGDDDVREAPMTLVARASIAGAASSRSSG